MLLNAKVISFAPENIKGSVKLVQITDVVYEQY